MPHHPGGTQVPTPGIEITSAKICSWFQRVLKVWSRGSKGVPGDHGGDTETDLRTGLKTVEVPLVLDTMRRSYLPLGP